MRWRWRGANYVSTIQPIKVENEKNESKYGLTLGLATETAGPVTNIGNTFGLIQR